MLPIQNYLQFDTITKILDKKVKSQWVSGTPMK